MVTSEMVTGINGDWWNWSLMGLEIGGTGDW